MKLKPLLVSCAALALTASFHSGAQAQTKWDMPTPYSDGEFHTINVRQFAEDVKKATGGQIDIVVHSNGSLIKHPDILRAVSTGQVAVGEILLGQFGNEDPVFAADNVPFLAVGWDNAWKFYQAQKPLLNQRPKPPAKHKLHQHRIPLQRFTLKQLPPRRAKLPRSNRKRKVPKKHERRKSSPHQ